MKKRKKLNENRKYLNYAIQLLHFYFCLPADCVSRLCFLRRKASIWPISWIVLASLFYYGWWNPKFLLLLLASISANLLFGKIILNTLRPAVFSKIILISGIIFNLSVLAYFKYAGFLVSNWNELFASGLPSPNIVLPIGISFITFQKIAFLVDAYRGQVHNFTILNYIFFVTFFPQLIAGPIVHHAELMPQLSTSTQRNLKADFAIGISIFIIGLFKKVVIADTFALFADTGYNLIKGGHALDTASAWVSVLSYALQLYYDFSGYSDMAIGLGRMFGIHLPLNFYSPYQADSIIDFWRRWHITLSRFLRDYLYVPLGGNRTSSIRRYINLGIVMLLGGLWHGANWTFALWGGIHGGMLACNHSWRKFAFTQHPIFFTKPMRIITTLFTFLCVTLAWIPFRAETIGQAHTMFHYLFPITNQQSAVISFKKFWNIQFAHFHLKDMLIDWFKPQEFWPANLPAEFLATMAGPIGIILLLNLLALFLIPNTAQLFANFSPALGMEAQADAKKKALPSLNRRVASIIAFLFVLSVLRLTHVSPFLYFQF